jgi:hypothetical protein
MAATAAGASSLPRAISCSVDKPAAWASNRRASKRTLSRPAADRAAAASRSRLS